MRVQRQHNAFVLTEWVVKSPEMAVRKTTGLITLTEQYEDNKRIYLFILTNVVFSDVL